jgi:hypothetical protein
MMRNSLLLLAAAALPAAAPAATYSVSNVGSLSSGRYGGTDQTRVETSSISLRSQVRDWEFGIVLPYLSIENQSSAALSLGGAVIGSGLGTRRRQSGYGDMTLRLARQVPLGENASFQARIAGQIKLPTGARTMTTGKLDGGLTFELSRPMGRVTPFVSAGYRTFGDTRLLRLRDGWATSAGMMMTLGKVSLIASHETAQSPFAGPGSRELFAAASGPLAPGWGWSLFGTKGYSAGAPKMMIGTSLTRSFAAR